MLLLSGIEHGPEQEAGTEEQRTSSGVSDNCSGCSAAQALQEMRQLVRGPIKFASTAMLVPRARQTYVQAFNFHFDNLFEY